MALTVPEMLKRGCWAGATFLHSSFLQPSHWTASIEAQLWGPECQALILSKLLLYIGSPSTPPTAPMVLSISPALSNRHLRDIKSRQNQKIFILTSRYFYFYSECMLIKDTCITTIFFPILTDMYRV